MEANQLIVGDAREHAQVIHRVLPPTRRVYPIPTALIEWLPKGRGRRRIILGWLGDRVQWTAVHHWIRGRRAIPQWAAIIFANEIMRQRRKYDRALDELAQKEKAGD